MKYRPYWQRIFLLALILNLALWFSSSSLVSISKTEETQDLIEVEWIETENISTVAQEFETSQAEIFPEIVMPELEIPHTIFEPLPKLDIEPPKEIIKPAETENKTPEEKPIENKNEPPEEKSETNPADKLKVIVKVSPKDIVTDFTTSGVSEKKVLPQNEKIVLEVTITTVGKVRNAKILSGGDNGIIDFIAKTAVQSWIFEPYLDAEGNPQELKTRIEFQAEDF